MARCKFIFSQVGRQMPEYLIAVVSGAFFRLNDASKWSGRGIKDIAAMYVVFFNSMSDAISSFGSRGVMFPVRRVSTATLYIQYQK